MTRRVLVSLVAGALACPWLPLYVARSMTRAQTGEGGDRIGYDWQFHTLPGFLDAMQYMRPEESPELYLAIDLALAVVYAGLLAWLVHLVLARAFVARAQRDGRP